MATYSISSVSLHTQASTAHTMYHGLSVKQDRHLVTQTQSELQKMCDEEEHIISLHTSFSELYFLFYKDTFWNLW